MTTFLKGTASPVKHYRITGFHSVERITPILPLTKDVKWIECASLAEATSQRLDLVWETTCEMVWREVHKSARVYNCLHNTTILEDKSNLAFLQLRMKCPTLTTFVAKNGSDVISWAQQRWKISGCNTDKHGSSIEADNDWWAVKASKGNGGTDIFIIHEENFKDVLAQAWKGEEYVIQRCRDVSTPQLLQPWLLYSSLITI
jgi:hypothetical protein